MIKLLLSAIALSLSFSAYAQEQTSTTEGETKMKVEDAADKKNNVDGDIDQEITNARMRAESGSKSKFSLSSSVGYTGGAISRPFGSERPNLAGTPDTQEDTSVDGTLSGRFRWTKSDSLTLGVGFGIITPFQGDTDANSNQLNIYDPSLGYSRVGKVGAFQSIASVSLSGGTSKESQNIAKIGTLGASYNMLYSSTFGLTVGSSLAGSYTGYTNDPGDLNPKAPNTRRPGFYGGDRRTEWTVALYPYAEYAFNDWISARTVFGYFNWRHLYGDTERYRLLQTFVYQSVGVGLAVTRDLYLYPNIQFVPDNIRSDFTNVALSATINMF
jgi:hypothetical protein